MKQRPRAVAYAFRPNDPSWRTDLARMRGERSGGWHGTTFAWRARAVKVKVEQFYAAAFLMAEDVNGALRRLHF